MVKSIFSGYKAKNFNSVKPPERFVMYFPTPWRGDKTENAMRNRPHNFARFVMPQDVYDHKEYPLCLSCDTKFVPIDKGDEWCFKCNITK